MSKALRSGWAGTRFEWFLNGIPGLVLLGSLVWCISRFYLLYDYGEFGDESEHIVLAAMLEHGGRIYDNVMAHQGPLGYMLGHLLFKAGLGWSLHSYRIVILSLYLFPAWAIWTSPLVPERGQKQLALSLFCLFLGTFTIIWHGHMLLYHSLAGICYIIILSRYLMPLLLGFLPSKQDGWYAGFCGFAMFYLAYAYAITLFLSFMLCVWAWKKQGVISWRGQIRVWAPFAVGGLACSVLMILWLMKYGSLLGYAVYHFYFNQVIYSQFIKFEWLRPYTQLWDIDSYWNPLGWTYPTFCGLLFWGLVLLGRRLYRKSGFVTAVVVSFALASAVLYTNPRNSVGFHIATLCLSSLAIWTLMVGYCYRGKKNWGWFCVSILCGVMICRVGLFHFYNGFEEHIRNRSIRAFKKLDHPERYYYIPMMKSLTTDEDRIAAYVYKPVVNLMTQRLAASGHYYYLPWQASHVNHVLWLKPINICEDLQKNHPVFMYNDEWFVWGHWQFRDYAPCFYEIAQKSYTLVAKQLGNLYLDKARWQDLLPRVLAHPDMTPPEEKPLPVQESAPYIWRISLPEKTDLYGISVESISEGSQWDVQLASVSDGNKVVGALTKAGEILTLPNPSASTEFVLTLQPGQQRKLEKPPCIRLRYSGGYMSQRLGCAS